MRDTVLRRLKDLQSQAEQLSFASVASGEFKTWQLSVHTALDSLFGTGSAYVQEFDKVWFTPGVTYSDTEEWEYAQAFSEGLVEARAVLDAAIDAGERYSVMSRPATTNTSSAGEGHVDVSTLSVGALLRLLTPAQAWGLAVALAALVLGAFTVGTKLTEYKLDRSNARIEALEEVLKESQAKIEKQPRAIVQPPAELQNPDTNRVTPLELVTVPGVSPKNHAAVIGSTEVRLGVRPLVAIEDDKPLEAAPSGTFGFMNAIYFYTYSNDDAISAKLYSSPVNRSGNPSRYFQVARLKEGAFLFAFVAPADGVRISHLDGAGVEVVMLSPMPWSEASTLVLLPIDRIVGATTRQIETESDHRISVVDASVR